MSKSIIGEVLKKSGTKTVSVLVKRVKKHPLYKKRIILTNKFTVHDETEISKIGDRVEIKSVKPISKKKKYSISKIIKND